MTDRVEDLSALARRGALPKTEAAELEGLFSAEPEERFWHQAGSALDEEEAAAVVDDEAAARVVDRLLRELPRKKPLLRRHAFALPVAAALLVASLAAAAIATVRHLRTATPVHRAPLLPSASPPAPTTPNVGAAVSAEPPPSPALLSSGSPAPAPPAAAAPDVQLRPADLLSSAGRARRSGNSNLAVALLERLQTSFPNSPEASVSDISLGKLLLQSGDASSALQHFGRYLQRSGSGSLAPEALWGRGQAFWALGNQTEARKAWTELTQRFPSSPYAGLANAKLHGSSLAPL